MRILRSHPVLFAALIGVVIGIGNTLAVEIPALFGKPSKGVLALLEPISHSDVGTSGSNAPQTAFLLLIEVSANVLVWAAMFSVLGLLFVGVRRIFRSARRRSAGDDSPRT